MTASSRASEKISSIEPTLERFESIARQTYLFTAAPSDLEQALHPFETRNIHESLPAKVRELFDNGHYSEATFEAFKFIDKEVQRLSGLNESGVKLMMSALSEDFLGENDMMAYLTMMANRLLELHRVLKPTGSLYLHCDPTASHYLKIVLDGVFGKELFKNEIVWRRTRGHNDKTLKKFGAIHDVILYFSKTDQPLFNVIKTDRDEDAPKTHDLYRHSDGKLYRKGDCRAPGNRGPLWTWEWYFR